MLRLPKAFGRTIRRRLASAGYVYFNTRSREYYAQDSLFTTNSDHFREEPLFRAAYERGVKAGSGVDPHIEWRVRVALWAARLAMRAPGSFVECGVNAGLISSAIMEYLRWSTAGRSFYLIDTFQGPILSQYSPTEIESGRLAAAQDAIERGAYVTDLERIRANYSEWPSAELIQGAVPDVLNTVAIGAVAFLHLDMNCALPERAALEFFDRRLSPGAVVLFDDYSQFGHDSLREAIDASCSRLGLDILSLPTGQGLIVK